MYVFFKEDAATQKRFFITQQGTMHVELKECLHCGKEHVMSSDVQSEICVDCQRRCNYYRVQTSKVSEASGLKALRSLKDSVDFYQSLRDKGVTYKVPKNLDEQSKRVDALLDAALLAESQKEASRVVAMPVTTCKDCGCQIDAGVLYGGWARCAACADRYTRYQKLMRSCGVLSKEECDELVDILRFYVAASAEGHKVPYFTGAISKLNRRLEALGAERAKIL